MESEDASDAVPAYMQMSQDCVMWKESDTDAALPTTTTTTASGTNLPCSNMSDASNDKHEIESLFSLLGKNGEERVIPTGHHQRQEQPPHNDDDDNGDGCAADDDFPTPLHRNHAFANNTKTRHSFPPPSSTTTTSDSGNRKKRPDSFGGNHPEGRHEKLHKRSDPDKNTTSNSATTNSSNLSPVPIPNRGQHAHRGGIMTGFDDLLQQVETPSLNTTTTTTAPVQQQEQQQRQEQRQEPKHPRNNGVPQSTIAANSTASSAIANNSKSGPASVNASRMRPTSLSDHAFLKHGKENVSASTSLQQQPQSSMRNKVTPLADHQKEAAARNTETSSSRCQQSAHAHNQKSEPAIPTKKETNKVVVPCNNVNAAAKTNATTGVIVDEFGDGDDEFGDFDLSEEDFAQVDSLVAATQAQNYSQQQQQGTPQTVPSAAQTNPILLAAGGPSNNDNNVGATTTKIEPTNGPHSATLVADLKANATHKFEIQDEDDPFGDFPDDFDFDALDQAKPGATIPSAPQSTSTASSAIIAQNVHSKGDTKSFNKIDDPFDDFPDDIDFDALDAAVAATQQVPDLKGAVMSTGGGPNQQEQPPTFIVQNQHAASWDDETSYLAFSRYKIVRFEKDETTYTQRLFVKTWDSSMLQDDDRQALHKPSTLGKVRKRQVEEKKDDENLGMVILRGSWFYLDVEDGDILHLCSLTGRFKTDASALPIILDTEPPPGSDYDDLVPIIHPEMLAIPTTVTETLDCTRRAVLKNRLGSKFSSSKALLLGTMRHTLFEVALKTNDTTPAFVQYHMKKIVRAEAEKLVGCRMSSIEAERELSKFWPQVQFFKREYINSNAAKDHRFATLGDISSATATKFAATEVKGVEEEVTSPELGLKGNVDVLVEAMATPTDGFDRWLAAGGPNSPQARSLMSVELKTHHNAKPQPKHFAQLTYYTVMLLSRFGHNASASFKKNPGSSDAVAGSMLLYINNESLKALHVAPRLMEIKSLIEQRNTFCSASKRASRPRGVTLSYEDEESAPKLVLSQATPTVLPTLENPNQCSRCFSARECMIYAATGSLSEEENNSHAKVLDQFTGQLCKEDFDYFRTWDRLIDLEADATSQSVAEAWLEKSEIREKTTSKCISSLVYQPQPSQVESLPDDGSVAFIVFKRASNASLRTPLSSLQLQKGCYVTCSTDATSLDNQRAPRGSVSSQRPGRRQAPFRHQMKIFRGTVDHIDGNDKIAIRTSENSVARMNDLLSRFGESASNGTNDRPELTFRIDSDNSFSQMGTLRLNLVDFLTKDKDVDKSKKDPDLRMVWIQKRYARLRELVIKLKPPVFEEAQKESMFNPPARVRSLPGCDPTDLVFEFTTLNENQRTAAQKVASMSDYTLIQGLPGTGKTSTIVFVARMLAAQGKRVLITSYTHSAVDNCLLKLIESDVASVWDERPTPAVLRIGNKSSVHSGVQSILVSKVAADLEASRAQEDSADMPPSAESFRKVVAEARIVGVTALMIPKSPLLAAEHFDVVIVDEAGQITQPALLGAICAADKFCLVGDHKQLPPLVASESALEGGFGDSMLKRLAEAHPDAVVQLKLQYRMHKEICSLASQNIYNGNLACAIDIPRLQLPAFPKALSSQSFGNASTWVNNVVNPFRPVVFADTDAIGRADGNATLPTEEQSESIVPLERAASRQAGGNMVNDTEAILVTRIVEALVAVGLSPSSIGVICPFNAQIRLLDDSHEMKKLKTEGLEVSTIDKYQGRDKEVIIVSFVRSNNKGKVGRLLEATSRINVAITRAKRKLILVGSFSTLRKGSATLQGILDQIQQLGRVEKLPANAAV